MYVCNESEYNSELDAVVESWQNALFSSTAYIQKFVDWFLSNKSIVIHDTMLCPIRQECGLGYPPEPFTANSSESINAVLKRKVNYKKSELPDFIDRIKEVIDEQQEEVECTIIGRGKYKLRPQYSTLEVKEAKWFAMTVQQRQKHILAFNRAEVVSMVDHLHNSSISSVKSKTTCGMSLSVSCEDFVKDVNIPLKCLEGIWEKATQLLNTDGAIVPAPGQKPEA